MKRRIYASALVGLLGTLTASACDSNSDYGNGYGGDPAYYCRQYTSCGTCTPVLGCGWCQTAGGKGMCADDPNDCAGATAFSWTWEPSGCSVTIADASVSSSAPRDAAPSIPPSPTVDAAPPGAAIPSDAGGDAPLH